MCICSKSNGNLACCPVRNFYAAKYSLNGPYEQTGRIEHLLMSAYERVLMICSSLLMSTCSSAHKRAVLLNNKAFLYKASASRMSCRFCEKAINRGCNLRRHEKRCRPLKDQEREMSETESQTMDSEDDASTTSTSGSESPMTTDSETETEEDEKDSWMPMV